MKKSGHIQGNRKLKTGTLILLCLLGGFGCGGSGSSSTPSADLLTHPQDDASGGLDTENQNIPVTGEPDPQIQDIVVVQQKSQGLRKGVCWNGRSQLREVNRKRLRNNANRSCGAVNYQRKLNLLFAAN